MSFYRSLIAAVAAMGLTTVAFADDMNTVQGPATTGQQVSQTTETTTTTDATTTTTQDKINVNKATAKELMKVKGMNAAKAKAIVAYRKKHGEFKTLDDLKDVKGFNKMDDDTMKTMQDQLTTG